MDMKELFQFEDETHRFESAKVSNVCLRDECGVINITGHQNEYGLIYLTYNMTENPKHETQGSFRGKAVGIGPNGEKNEASLNGVWSRSGRMLTLYSLDDISDGNLYFALVKINLVEETAEISFSSFVR